MLLIVGKLNIKIILSGNGKHIIYINSDGSCTKSKIKELNANRKNYELSQSNWFDSREDASYLIIKCWTNGATIELRISHFSINSTFPGNKNVNNWEEIKPIYLN